MNPKTFRLLILATIGCIVYGLIIAPTTICLERGICDSRTAIFILLLVNFVTFIMAFIALFNTQRSNS